MSNTANWSYANQATVRPFVNIDLMTGQSVYGEPFTIACTWIAEAQQMRDGNGAEFVSRYLIFTEDPRPKYLDMIQLRGHDEWQEVRAVTEWDMSFFGEIPDYRLAT